MHDYQLRPLSGEFVSRKIEVQFQSERLPETIRHAAVLFFLSVILNTLFFASDWRFFGDPHFYLAIPSRAIVVLASIVCWFRIRRTKSFQAAQLVMIAWSIIVSTAVGVLVSSHSEIALFVVVMLPAIIYLVVPASFAVTVACGVFCSMSMLAGYLIPTNDPLALGLTLAMVTLNFAAAIVVARSNRLRRMEWAATQRERDVGRQLDESRRRFEQLFTAIPIPLIIARQSDGRVLAQNGSAAKFFSSNDSRGGIDFVRDVLLDEGLRATLAERLKHSGQIQNVETILHFADGSTRDVLVAGAAINIDGINELVAGIVDITTQKSLERQLERIATTDALTGVSNRRHFFQLGEQLTAAAWSDLAVAMIDVDHFKQINDTYGHNAGDTVLLRMAETFSSIIDGPGVLARVGGEEFAMLIPNADRATALSIAEQLRKKATEIRYPDIDPDLRTTVSIGVSEVAKDECDFSRALARADACLYAAKRSGRNCVLHSSEILGAVAA